MERLRIKDKLNQDLFDYKKIVQLPRIVRRYVTFGRQADNDLFADGQQSFARQKQVELLNKMTKPEWESLVTFANWQSEVVTTRLRRREKASKQITLLDPH